MNGKRRHVVAIAALAGALAWGGGASAQELVYGSWLPAGEYLNRVALPKIFAAIEKDTAGAVKWKLVAGGQLADPKTTFQAVQTGLMTAGIGISSYVPSLVPSLNTIYSTVVFGDDNVATSAAALETLTLHCPSCIAEFKKINSVPLSGWVAGPYRLTCREPVKSLADLKGKRVRATGGSTELMTLAGAVPVSATLVEAVGLLQRGSLFCQFGTNGWLRVFGYADVVKNLTDFPLGMTGPAVGLMLNRDVWNKMSPEMKKLHIKYAAYLSASLSLGQFVIEEESVLRNLQQTKGLKVIHGNAKEFETVIAKYETVQRERNIAHAKQLGVPDPGAIIDAYAKAREKWGRLSPGIGRDIDKFAAAIQREIYDKVDPANL
jgi:TRAP-type C4-dicarboxylate transport system substrate-binding protein